jgi:deoxyribonuclease-4
VSPAGYAGKGQGRLPTARGAGPIANRHPAATPAGRVPGQRANDTTSTARRLPRLVPMSARVGAHVDQTDPIAEAGPAAPTLVQFFLGDPQSYKGPVIRVRRRAEGLRADAEAAGIDLYVHAPYLVNVATTNNRIRIPSRKLLQQHMDAAAEIGAKGLIVHGGHVKEGRRPRDRLRQLAQGDRGDRPQAPAADREHRRRRQRDGPPSTGSPASGTRSRGHRAGDLVGFCLDTCHAHAGGNPLETIVDDVRAITGRIDLVHANDSRDDFDSGADRHANFGAGQIDPDLLAAVVRDAGAPVVCETPGGASEHTADIAWLLRGRPARARAVPAVHRRSRRAARAAGAHRQPVGGPPHAARRRPPRPHPAGPDDLDPAPRTLRARAPGRRARARPQGRRHAGRTDPRGRAALLPGRRRRTPHRAAPARPGRPRQRPAHPHLLGRQPGRARGAGRPRCVARAPDPPAARRPSSGSATPARSRSAPTSSTCTALERGSTFGYRGAPSPAAATCSSSVGGPRTASASRRPAGDLSLKARATTLARGGLDAAGLVRSPYVVDGKQRYFAEPPHMQARCSSSPTEAHVPAIGDEVDVRGPRYTATAPFDRQSSVS